MKIRCKRGRGHRDHAAGESAGKVQTLQSPSGHNPNNSRPFAEARRSFYKTTGSSFTVAFFIIGDFKGKTGADTTLQTPAAHSTGGDDPASVTRVQLPPLRAVREPLSTGWRRSRPVHCRDAANRWFWGVKAVIHDLQCRQDKSSVSHNCTVYRSIY